MPNYNLAINASFQPFSMQELLAPVMGATASLREVEDAYSKQQTEADQLEYVARLLEQEGSPESMATAQKYRNYQNQIQQAADELMETGQISKGRKTLWDMTRKYGTDVLPLKAGYEQLAADMKTQATTPGAAFKKRVSMNDLASYIADPMGVSLNQGTVDLKDIEKLSSDLFSQYAKALRWSKGSKEWDDVTDVLEKQYGLTPQEAEYFLNNPDSDTALAQIRDIVKTRTGANEDWNDWYRINASINSGVWSAIGDRKMELEKDWIEQQRRAAENKGKGKGDSIDVPLAIRNLYTVERNSFLLDSKTYKVGNDGRLQINPEGLNKNLDNFVNKIAEIATGHTGSISTFNKNKSDVKKIDKKDIFNLIDAGVDIKNTRGNSIKYEKTDTELVRRLMESSPEIAQVWEDYVTHDWSPQTLKNNLYKAISNWDINAREDLDPVKIHKQVQYLYRPKTSEQESVKRAFLGDLPDDNKNGFTIVKLSKDGNSAVYKNTNEHLSKSDFKEGEIVFMGYDNNSRVARVLKKNGNYVMIRIPGSQENIDKIFNNMSKVSEKVLSLDSNSNTYVDDYSYYNSIYRQFEDMLRPTIGDTYRPDEATPQKSDWD